MWLQLFTLNKQLDQIMLIVQMQDNELKLILKAEKLTQKNNIQIAL